MLAGRIVILDDELSVAQTIGLMAESIGLEATVTHNAAAFFQALENQNADYIALDLVMPDMDGVEVMRQLAQLDCRAKIVVISGMANRVLNASERSASEHGLNVIGSIAKPFSARELRVLLERSGDALRSPCALLAERNDCTFALSERDLLEGLEQHQFVVAYQPKIHCMSGKIAGFEALARWHHPDLGVIMPDRFISIAEHAGLMDPLTGQLMAQALAWFHQHILRDRGGEPSPPVLSVNISAKNLQDIHFADKVFQLCNTFAVPPACLMLELTETSTMADPTLSLDLFTRLRVKGFHLSLDDFGTGYSSMAQLVRLPFSEIKVDRSFVMSAMESQESRTVVRTIVELGQNLGLRTTAEGLEDEETLMFLRQLGCDFVQGHFFTPPLYDEDLRQWMSGYQRAAGDGRPRQG
ncbi:MAG: EAL domain-containing response regulator [Porticoccaceae bacterium]